MSSRQYRDKLMMISSSHFPFSFLSLLFEYFFFLFFWFARSYKCDQYVTQDNKKEDLETIRKLLFRAQTVDETASTTRSGRVIRPPVKILTNNE